MLPEELLLRVCNGDNTAFRELYGLFKDRVYNTCISYLQHTNDAEEATQDVFVEIHRASSSFKGGSTVSTWIYRITVNKCLDRLRYSNRQKRFAFLTSLFQRETGNLIHDPVNFEHPGISLEKKELAKYLFAAIRQLPQSQQTAFILKQVEGLSQREVAAIMELGEKAVESLLQRAKANLRNILSNFYNQNEGLNNS